MTILKSSFRVGDCICIVNDDLLGNVIQLVTGKGADHCAIVCDVGSGNLMAAEMEQLGACIVSIEQFQEKYDGSKIAGVKRIQGISDDDMLLFNKAIMSRVQSAPKYDDGELFDFLPLGTDLKNNKECICSQFAELCANDINRTFARWQLETGNPLYKKYVFWGEPKKIISPTDILRGNGSITIV